MQDLIYQYLKKVKNFKTKTESYSPTFSSIGLCMSDDENGVNELYFNYNHRSRAIFDKVADFPFALNKELSSIYKLVFGNGEISLAFWKNDAFIIECNKIDKLTLVPSVSEDTSHIWVDYFDGEEIIFKGFTENHEEHDPDQGAPFVFGIRAIVGKITNDNVVVAHPGAGKLILAFSFEGLLCSTDSVRSILEIAPENVNGASILCRRWLRNYSRDFDVDAANEREAELIADSIRTLLFNATKAQGCLNNYISPFPSRGSNPAVYLWDTYFQNVGYSLMGTNLHRDFLRQIAAHKRTDGKLPRYMCSTWDRPGETQPALLGWSVMNSMENDPEFAWEMLPVIESNNKWWLSSRMTHQGLIYCPSSLETGMGNTPRFDNGPVVAVDMNSYVLHQLRCTAEIARRLGIEGKAKHWDVLADKLSDNIVKYLYSDKDYLFYDMNPDTCEKVKVVTAASFLPLWAGVNLEKKKTDRIFKKYLLSSKYMFGEIPFPSVGYSDKNYDPSDYWRGPTWIPIVWLMLETLRKHGYEREFEIAASRIYDMIANSDEMCGMFDSSTGKGIGNTQQGWTCSIFLKLVYERNKK